VSAHLLGETVEDDRELQQVLPRDVVAKRWDQMLDAEATLIRAQSPGPRMHSGIE
jgi:hypothetical protein